MTIFLDVFLILGAFTLLLHSVKLLRSPDYKREGLMLVIGGIAILYNVGSIWLAVTQCMPTDLPSDNVTAVDKTCDFLASKNTRRFLSTATLGGSILIHKGTTIAGKLGPRLSGIETGVVLASTFLLQKGETGTPEQD